MIGVAINGFGRIGRIFLRTALERNKNNFIIKIINDPNGAENAAYLFNN